MPPKQKPPPSGWELAEQRILDLMGASNPYMAKVPSDLKPKAAVKAAAAAVGGVWKPLFRRLNSGFVDGAGRCDRSQPPPEESAGTEAARMRTRSWLEYNGDVVALPL